MVSGDRFDPMPPSMLANERDEFYLYDVMRLVPLQTPAVTPTSVPRDSLGQRGFRASQSGRPDLELYVDDDGRLAHLRTWVAHPMSAGSVRQDVWLVGEIAADGVRWPQTIPITLGRRAVLRSRAAVAARVAKSGGLAAVGPR